MEGEKRPEEVLDTIGYAMMLSEANKLTGTSLEELTGRAAVLLIAAAKAIHEMAYAARHSIASTPTQTKIIDKAARDAAGVSKQAGDMAQGALNWLRFIDPGKANICRAQVQEAVNNAGWNPKVTLVQN